MNFVVFFVTLLATAAASGGPAWNQSVQRGSGLKIGTGGSKNASSSRGNGIRVGSMGRGSRTTTTTTTASSVLDNVPTTSVPSFTGVQQLHVGMVVPYKSFGVREYTKAFMTAKHNLARKFVELFRKSEIHVHTDMKELTPSPTGN